MTVCLVIKNPMTKEVVDSIEIPQAFSAHPGSIQILADVIDSMEGFTCDIAAANLSDILFWLYPMVFETKRCRCHLKEWVALYNTLDEFLSSLEENLYCVVVEYQILDEDMTSLSVK